MTWKEPITNDAQSETPPAGFDLADIYYALFRQKWKILVCFLVGIVVSAALYFIEPPVYQSQAKLLVRYVLEREGKSFNPAATDFRSDSQIKSPDSGGASVINTEREILSSFDLASQVAELIGPEKILAKAGGGTNRIEAAALIERNLLVETRKDNSTIWVVFRHRDPQIVQPVLRNLIDAYQKRHVEVHRVGSVIEEDLTRKTDELKGKLGKIEEELRGWLDRVGVTSVDDAKKAHIDQISKIREDLFKAEAELAGRRAGLKELQGAGPKKTEDGAGEGTVPAEKTEQYRNVLSEMDSLRKMETNLLAQFTGESLYVRNVRERMTDFEKQKRTLEEEYPRLARPNAVSIGAGNPAMAAADPAIESYRITALEAATNTLHSQLEMVLAEASEIKKASFRCPARANRDAWIPGDSELPWVVRGS